jgi:hypothetical protein
MMKSHSKSYSPQNKLVLDLEKIRSLKKVLEKGIAVVEQG